MKKLFLIPLALGLSFCHCQKAAVAATPTKSSIESVCPENGVCTIKIQKGKSMAVKTDEFGSIYYTTEDNANKSIIIYEYIFLRFFDKKNMAPVRIIKNGIKR